MRSHGIRIYHDSHRNIIIIIYQVLNIKQMVSSAKGGELLGH